MCKTHFIVPLGVLEQISSLGIRLLDEILPRVSSCETWANILSLSPDSPLSERRIWNLIISLVLSYSITLHLYNYLSSFRGTHGH